MELGRQRKPDKEKPRSVISHEEKDHEVERALPWYYGKVVGKNKEQDGKGGTVAQRRLLQDLFRPIVAAQG